MSGYERAILGAMMLGDETTDSALKVLGEADFRQESHRIVFHSIRALRAAGQVIDIVTVCDFLRKEKALKSVGGAPGLNELFAYGHSSVPIEYFARAMKGQA